MPMIARIEGYASVFNTPDLNGDVVSPGAFGDALRKKSPNEIRMLYQHAPDHPIGRWTRLHEDTRGLYAEGELILDSALAKETYALLAGGALDGLSIGFQTVRAMRHDRRAERFILEADLWEISVVTFPMAPGARVLRLGDPESACTKHEAFAATLVDAARVLAPEACGLAFPLGAFPPTRSLLEQSSASPRGGGRNRDAVSGGGLSASFPHPEIEDYYRPFPRERGEEALNKNHP